MITDDFLLKIKDSPNEDRVDNFIKTLVHFIEIKDGSLIKPEQVGDFIIPCSKFKEISESSILEEILDQGSVLEIPRETSYKQGVGNWNSKVADKLKEEEWDDFILAFKNVLKFRNEKT